MDAAFGMPQQVWKTVLPACASTAVFPHSREQIRSPITCSVQRSTLAATITVAAVGTWAKSSCSSIRRNFRIKAKLRRTAGTLQATGGEGSDGVSHLNAEPPSAEPGDRLVRYLGGNVSVRALTATGLVRDVCSRHEASPIVSLALGRALMGTALLANGRDAGETLQLRISGGGPCGTVLAEASSSMECRGYVAEPQADAKNVPELVGVGQQSTLRVTRTHPFWKQPYTGTVQLQSGEIAEDIVQYLATSEQTPASMGLNVEWDNELGCVKHAEGWLVTLLPGWDDGSVGVVEANIASFARMPAANKPRPEAICEHMMRELCGEFQIEEQLKWKCTCSQQRLLRAVMMFGKTEVLQMLKEKKDVEATCDWCGRRLSVTPEQIREHMKTDEGKNEVETRSASPRQLKLQEEDLLEVPSPGTADWS